MFYNLLVLSAITAKECKGSKRVFGLEDFAYKCASLGTRQT